MTQDLTTRDIFQQLDTRLSRVEDDLRTFRSEVSAFRSEVSQRFEHGDQRFDQLQWRMVSLFIITWVTVIGSIWLKP